MSDRRIVILISADAEWRAVKEILMPADVEATALGETFVVGKLTYFHGGWGKISAAATTQLVIDQFEAGMLVNLGTCGGFEGRIERGSLLLVTKTIVYDINEQMSDPEAAISHYSTELELDWLPERLPFTAQRGLMLSADRDIVAGELGGLVEKYGAVAADWESGAIAWVAKRNGVRCLILRGVTDLVGAEGGEAYGAIEVFHENTNLVMKSLLERVPDWLEKNF